MNALRAADREALADCFSPTEREKYMSDFERMPPETMADMANSVTAFAAFESESGPYREAAVTRSNGQAGIAQFVKSERGWLISQLP